MTVTLQLSQGEALIGQRRVAIAPAGPGGEIRIDGWLPLTGVAANTPDGHVSTVLQPIDFWTRSRLARQAQQSPNPRRELAFGIRTAATVTPGTIDVQIVDVLAMYLAGATSGGPGFADCATMMARTFGWGPDAVAALTAADVDRLAADAQRAHAATAPTADDGWNRIMFDAPTHLTTVADHSAAEIDRIWAALADDLLKRSAEGPTGTPHLETLAFATRQANPPDPTRWTGANESHVSGVALVPDAVADLPGGKGTLLSQPQSIAWPTWSQPALDQPTLDQPAVQQPTLDRLTTHEPVVRQPTLTRAVAGPSDSDVPHRAIGGPGASVDAPPAARDSGSNPVFPTGHEWPRSALASVPPVETAPTEPAPAPSPGSHGRRLTSPVATTNPRHSPPESVANSEGLAPSRPEALAQRGVPNPGGVAIPTVASHSTIQPAGRDRHELLLTKATVTAIELALAQSLDAIADLRGI